jgi:hypothetical protein
MLIIYEISIISIILLFLVGILLIYRNSKRGKNTPKPVELVGKRAKVFENITFGGLGKIKYIMNGNHYITPARSTNGTAVRVDKDVVICWIEAGIAYVVSINDIEQ